MIPEALQQAIEARLEACAGAPLPEGTTSEIGPTERGAAANTQHTESGYRIVFATQEYASSPDIIAHELAHTYGMSSPFALGEGFADVMSECVVSRLFEDGLVPNIETGWAPSFEDEPITPLAKWATRSSLEYANYSAAFYWMGAAARAIGTTKLLSTGDPDEAIRRIHDQLPANLQGPWMAAYNGDATPEWFRDPDRDGRADFEERALGTDPRRWDGWPGAVDPLFGCWKSGDGASFTWTGQGAPAIEVIPAGPAGQLLLRADLRRAAGAWRLTGAWTPCTDAPVTLVGLPEPAATTAARIVDRLPAGVTGVVQLSEGAGPSYRDGLVRLPARAEEDGVELGYLAYASLALAERGCVDPAAWEALATTLAGRIFEPPRLVVEVEDLAARVDRAQACVWAEPEAPR